jgi:hypothetical protein
MCSKSASSLTSGPSSRHKVAIEHAQAFGQNVNKKLKAALFQHKESNYYECLPVKPCTGWFGALFEKVSNNQSRLTKSLLSVLDASVLETLCFVYGDKMLLRNSDSGLSVSIGDEALAEFLEHAQVWNASCDGCPIVVQKKSSGGCGNTCTPMDLVELKASLQRVSADDDYVVFQRFLPPRVRGCPSFVRIAWRDALAPKGFRFKSETSPEHLHAAGLDDKAAKWIVSAAMPGTQVTELRSIPSSAFRIADQVAHFTQTVFGLQLTQFVVDCLQDEHGNYYFVQVKSFTAQTQWLRRIRSAASIPKQDWQGHLRTAPMSSNNDNPEPKRRSSSTPGKKTIVPTAVCSMCTCKMPLARLSKRMTPKMMLETEHHLRRRNIQLFHVARVRGMGLSDLCAVCDACWSLYLAESELCRAEVRLAKSVGINVTGDACDEAYVPFGGVLSSVRSTKAQADFGGVHKMHDPFRIHDPLPAAPQPQLSHSAATAAQGDVKDSQWPIALRRGGEAIVYSEDRNLQPVTSPVPPAVLQWRMMIHVNRLMDIAAGLRDIVESSSETTPSSAKRMSKGSLTLRVEVPWQPETSRDIQLQPFGPQDDLSIQSTSVHYIFTDPAVHHPLHDFLHQSLVKCTLLISDASREVAPKQELLTGHLSLDRMADSISDGFLAQNWVMFCKHSKSQCQLKMTLGLVCDHTVSSEYVALRRYADAFVPAKPFFSSEVLPPTWTASIQGDKTYIPAQPIGLFSPADPAKTSSSNEAEADNGLIPSAEAIPRRCPAVLGGPLLIAPRPPSASTNK